MDEHREFGKHERSTRVATSIAVINSSFLSALQTSSMHPKLDICTAKGMKQFFQNIGTTTWVPKNALFVDDYKVLTMHGEGKQRIPVAG